MNRHALALVVLAALAALTLAGGDAAPPPVTPIVHKSRTLTIPVQFEPDLVKTIRMVQLLVSRDEGQTWSVEKVITPESSRFVYTAPADGSYWLSMLIVFKDGRTDPADPSKHPADGVSKNLIDTVPPLVRVTAVRQAGDEVTVEWAVEDKNPDDAATVVSWKPAGAGGGWQPLPPEAVSGRTARFRAAGPVTVQVAVRDVAGNAATVTRDSGAGPGTTAGYSPLVVPATASQPTAPQLPPPTLPAASPAGPAAPGPILPVLAPAQTLAPPVQQPAPALPPQIAAAPAALPTPAPLPPPSVTVATSAAPAWTPTPHPTAPEAGPPPIAVSGGPAVVPAPLPVPEPAGVQHVRFAQFLLPYQLDAGPSGVRQHDLYLTRDDGRTWVRWSQHDGRENPLRVNLLPRGGGVVDGDYGFKLVSMSGANLSDDVPTPGTPPDVRVRVDTTQPLIRVLQPEADPASRGTLLLRWQLHDSNMSEGSSVDIDWSDSPAGPWRSVAGAEPGAGRIPNTGSYPWQVPPTLPTHKVYLRFTATDPAGNRAEAVTPPQSVDLVRPRARIQAVVANPPPGPLPGR